MGKILGIAPGHSAGSGEHQTVAEGFAELGWEVLQLRGRDTAALPPVEIDFALAHPGFGVALVDLMHGHPEPVRRLRDRLDAVGFSSTFPGHLPVIHRVLGIDDLWRLSLILDPAFRSQPPMEIAGREWIGLVQRALVLEAVVPAHMPQATAAVPAKESSIGVEPVSSPPAPEELSDAPSPDGDAEAPPPAEPERADHAAASLEALAPAPVEEPAPAPALAPVLAPVLPPALAPWAERPPEEPQAICDVTPQPTASRRGRHRLWFLLVVTIAAGIGLSHHFALPEAWKAGWISLRGAGSTEPQEPGVPDNGGRSAGAAVITAGDAHIPTMERAAAEERLPASSVLLAEARTEAPLPDNMGPLPAEEAPRPDLFGVLAASLPPPPEPRGAPPAAVPDNLPAAEVPQQAQRPGLPPAEEVLLLPAQLAAAQPAPEESPAAIRITEAPPPVASEPARMPDSPQRPPEPEIAPEAATARIEPAEPPVPPPDPPPVSNPEMSPALPIEADRAPTPPPEPAVRAVAPPAQAPLPQAQLPQAPPPQAKPPQAPLSQAPLSQVPLPQATPPQATPPQATPPQAPPPQAPLPQAPLPQTPRPYAPLPQAKPPQAKPPQATPPQAPPPQAPPPQAPLPQAPLPQAPLPQAPLPRATLPQAPPPQAPPPQAPLPQATLPQAPLPQATRPQATLPQAMVEMLIARGDEMLARGDISGARLFYGRAASAGSAAAARAMGRSFDPEVLNRLGVRGIRPDPEQARQWYQRAEEAR
ncbi:MAG: hypothetical protein JWR00_1830 [Rubritepida sp.]|nr:hypothetical protein [Rubritepida sp.]